MGFTVVVPDREDYSLSGRGAAITFEGEEIPGRVGTEYDLAIDATDGGDLRVQQSGGDGDDYRNHTVGLFAKGEWYYAIKDDVTNVTLVPKGDE